MLFYNRDLLRLILCLILLAFSNYAQTGTSSLSPTDEASIRSVVTQFFNLYSGRNDSAISPLWDEKSPYFAAHRADMERIFANTQHIGVKSLILGNVTSEGENVKVRATVEFEATEAKSGKSFQVYPSKNRVVILSKTANNWCIVRHISAERDLATALVKIKNDDERRQILKGNELFNINLAKAVRDEGDALDGKIPPGDLADIYRLGLSIAEQLNDTDEIIKDLNDLGLALADTDKNKALDVYSRAMKLAEETGNKDMAARVYNNVGVFYFDQNDFVRSLDYAQKSVALAEEIGEKSVLVSGLGLIGNVYSLRGDYQRSLEFQQKALSIREEMKDDRGVSFSLNNIALVNVAQGNYQEAIDSLKRSIDLVHRGGAVQLYNLGNVYKLKGDLAGAMAAYQESIAVCEKRGSEGCIAAVTLNIGDLYIAQGDYDQAAQFLDRSLATSQKLGDKRSQATALGSISQMYQQLGELKKALENRMASLSLYKEMDYKSEIANSLNEIGNIYVALGDLDRASESFREGLKLSESLGENERISTALISIAGVQLAKNDPAAALRTAELAKSYFEKLVGMPDNWKLFSTLGQAHQKLGHTSEARQNFEKAVAAIEDLRANIIATENEQERFLGAKVAAYDHLIAFLVGQQDNSGALGYSERVKSRTLLDVLQYGRADLTKTMTVAEKTKEQQLRNALTSLNAQISKENGRTQPDAGRMAELQKQLGSKRLEFEDFQVGLYAVHPELRVLRGNMKPITLAEMPALMPDPKTALVEFQVAEDKTFVFVIKGISGKPELRVQTVDIKQKDLARQVDAYRSKLANGGLDFQIDSRALYDLLLKPVAAELAGKSNLIVVPDGPLWDLPLQALQNESGKYLAEQAAISYAPSLTALREMAKRGRTRRPNAETELVAFGNPIVGKGTSDRIKTVFMGEKLEPLPESERLVNELGKMYGPSRSKVYTGVEAREQTAKTEAPKYRIVQFATHGILNNTSPMYSHIVLSQKQDDPNEDGLLEAWELKDLDLKADMVILSACDTARGKISNGEGVIGMTWAAFIAGAPTTVASQWKVESKSTTELMLEFHRQLLTGKVSKAEALRRAELKVMKMPGYKHPSYWAGFVIVGDGS